MNLSGEKIIDLSVITIMQVIVIPKAVNGSSRGHIVISIFMIIELARNM